MKRRKPAKKATVKQSDFLVYVLKLPALHRKEALASGLLTEAEAAAVKASLFAKR